MKTLLAIINSPADSENFIRYTNKMAEDLNFNLHFLYIQSPALYSMSSGAIRAGAQPVGIEIEEDKKNAVNKIKEKVRKSKIDLSTVSIGAETGEADMVINRFISDNKADMVVLEGRDESGFWILDSANKDIIQKVNCPGWMIPSGIDYLPYKRVVYATDYNEADIKTLNNLIDVTGKYSPHITALHVTGSADFQERIKETGYKKMIEEETGYDKISVRSLIDRGEKSLGEYINDFALENQANLIVLLKENKGFTERLFKPGFTGKILKKTGLPVLIYQEGQPGKGFSIP